MKAKKTLPSYKTDSITTRHGGYKMPRNASNGPGWKIRRFCLRRELLQWSKDDSPRAKTLETRIGYFKTLIPGSISISTSLLAIVDCPSPRRTDETVGKKRCQEGNRDRKETEKETGTGPFDIA